MNDLHDFVARASEFLRQQRELYGDFSVNTIAGEVGETTAIPESAAETSEETAAFAVKVQTPSPQKKEVLPQTQRIAQCTNLDELRALCETADELKTDLQNTKLVFGIGNPRADLMVIGEAPGAKEDEMGIPFVGRAGKLLDDILKAINFTRDDVYIANILKHRPPDNRNPLPEEREKSLPYLLRQIELVNPKLILCAGKVPGTTLLGKEDSLTNMRQQFHAFHGRELMVTYHPAALLRNPHRKRPTWEDVKLLRKRYDELGCKP